MGILQGDSPTSGPAMYWQPYHTEETAMRVRPHVDDGNNNNNEGDMKMIQQQHNVDQQQTTFYNSQVKEERTDEHSNNEPVCRETAGGENQSTAAVCAGCSFKIADRYYLVAVDKAWHSECLRCDECRRPLDTALSCFARQSRIYCRDDYHRLFGGRKQCAKCCETLQPDELVMRGREHLFHTRCFSCHVCQTHLIKGSTFGMVGALIFCQQHYQQATASQQNNNVPAGPAPQPFGQQPTDVYMHHGDSSSFENHHLHHHQHFTDHHSYGQTLVQPDNMELGGKPYGSPVSASPAEPLKRARTKRRPSTKSDMMSMMNEDDSYMSVDGVGLLDTSSSSPSSMLNGCVMMPGGQQQQPMGQQQQQKTKRLRTSFKHHQLRMLKSYFATNHNPDAKDLKQLSQKTTLSKRVLQVWFQNARAKWRRLVQKSEGGQSGGSAAAGVNHGGSHNLSSSSSSSSSNCSGSGNETGSPIPSSSVSPSHARQPSAHHHQQQQPAMMMMGNFMEPHHHHPMMTSSSHSRMSLYDEISLSGSSSVASVGFPSPL